jgi:hypothetical protein
MTPESGFATSRIDEAKSRGPVTRKVFPKFSETRQSLPYRPAVPAQPLSATMRYSAATPSPARRPNYHRPYAPAPSPDSIACTDALGPKKKVRNEAILAPQKWS